MSNYCGYIEVWRDVNGKTSCHYSPSEIEFLSDSLEISLEFHCITIAIFKIRLDGGYNKTKQNEN